MTPYRNPDPGTIEGRYNITHSAARNIVERTICNLKSRFRCLQGQLYYSPLKASKIINVCCALQNICKHFNSEELNEDENEFEVEDEVEIEVENEVEEPAGNAANLRNNIARNL